MNKQTNSKLKKRALAVAVVSCLSFTPWLAQAAGLGKITVLSGLGQPLRAELEVSASREELVGMAARLAPQDAFKQAGIDFSAVLADLRFALDKRPDGKQVVKITSAKPVNEPFLDFLVELNWPSGRLVREYTFLLDPPDVVVKSAGRPLSVVEAKVVQIQAAPTPAPAELLASKSAAEASVKPEPLVKPSVQPSAQAKLPITVAKLETEPKKFDSTDIHLTKTGDTLGKIAAANLPQGVSLEQMLVGLYQNNPDAFIGKNLNRMKSGAILAIPDRSTVEAIPQAEAKKIFLAQSGDWNTYRQKLASAAASAPARDETANQQTTGKITAKVEEKALPAEQGKDQVKVSRSELPGKPAAGSGLAEEDRIAKDRALKEANERLAMLEKNVNELQKLLELKNQKLAELQQQTVAKPPEVKALEPAAPVIPATVAASVPTPVPEEAKPVEAPKPPPEPTPAVAPKPKPKPLPLPEPEPEPSFIETLLAQPLTLAGAGGVLALLLGYVFYKRRRAMLPAETTAFASSPSSLGESSVFRSTGGQSVNTNNTAPHTGDFSQTGPGTIDTDEVDPVAEADVYMAYGRDGQAEEILLEALQKDPQRAAIHGKLLEIYANRQSLKQFETLASEFYGLTAGVGPEWEKAAALGARLDPANPLYYAVANVAPLAAAFDADATMLATPARIDTSANEPLADLLAPSKTPPQVAVYVEDLDKQFTTTVVKESVPSVELLVEETIDFPELDDDGNDELGGLDFDLGTHIDNVASPVLKPELTAPLDEDVLSDDALDFDLGMPSPSASPVPPAVVEEDNGSALDFDLDLLAKPIVATAELAMDQMMSSSQLSPESVDDVDSDALEFDMVLDEPEAQGAVAATPNFDISSINLDLATEEASPDATLLVSAPSMPDIVAETPPELPTPQESVTNDAVDPVVREEINTKLDLAKAYEEMGDLEGARELLGEVAAEGPPDLASEAKEILARIGS